MGACFSSSTDAFVTDPGSRERETYDRELEETTRTLTVRGRVTMRETRNGKNGPILSLLT
jgi:hypothetical protein